MKKLLALLGVALLAGCQMPGMDEETPDDMENTNVPPMDEPMMDDETMQPPMEEEVTGEPMLDAEMNSEVEL